MHRNHPLYFIGTLFILFTAACTEPEKPVTKEEAATLAQTLETSIGNGSAVKFNEALDAEALQKRMMEEGGNKLDRSILAGTVKGLKTGQLGEQIVQSMGTKGSYQLVKQYEKDQHQHLVFRLYANDQLNYHDFELIKKRDQVKISDIFIYVTGENLSTTLAQTVITMSDNFSNVSSIDQKRLENIKKIRQLLNREEYTKAKALYKDIPAILKHTKLFKMINVQIASGLGNDEYLKALDEYRQAFPDAPNMYLLMIDAYFLKEDYSKALRCVNQLDSLINKDLFLDYYRGLISKMMENKEKQREYFEKLNTNMPAFSEGTWELLITYLDAKETDKAVALVNSRNRNYSKIDKEQKETLYLLYPDFAKKMGAVAN